MPVKGDSGYGVRRLRVDGRAAHMFPLILRTVLKRD